MTDRKIQVATNNLWHPVSGDHGAHGTFDERANSYSIELWLEMNRKWLGAAVGIVNRGRAIQPSDAEARAKSDNRTDKSGMTRFAKSANRSAGNKTC